LVAHLLRANSTPVMRRIPRRIGISPNPVSESTSGRFSTALPRKL
jgi:hypothetical protein